MFNTYTSIEDEAEADSESEGDPTLIKTSAIKSEIITESAVFLFLCIGNCRYC